MSSPAQTQRQPSQVLSLFSSVCIVVGIVVGVGIYETPPEVARNLPGPSALLALWLAGGLISLCGALCYAELAAAFPKEGGDYVYLSRAYGSWAGFLFGWTNLVTIRPGSIAAISFPFAHYLAAVCDPLARTPLRDEREVYYAGACIIILTTINILGVRLGMLAQNILTVVELLALCILIALIFAAPAASEPLITPSLTPLNTNVGLSLILILFCYGGWQEISYVAGEVKNPRKNLFRALLLGVLIITALYTTLNAAFVHALSYQGAANSRAVAAQAVSHLYGLTGGLLTAALICLSALGTLNGMILAGARIYYATGVEHRILRPLSYWSARYHTPVAALAVQGMLALLLVVLAGSFKQVLVYTTAVVWLFFFLTGMSVFVLRYREPNLPRPYRVTGHPLTTALFCCVCLYVTGSALSYDLRGSLIALGITLLGLPLYLLSRKAGLPRSGQR